MYKSYRLPLRLVRKALYTSAHELWPPTHWRHTKNTLYPWWINLDQLIYLHVFEATNPEHSLWLRFPESCVQLEVKFTDSIKLTVLTQINNLKRRFNVFHAQLPPENLSSQWHINHHSLNPATVFSSGWRGTCSWNNRSHGLIEFLQDTVILQYVLGLWSEFKADIYIENDCIDCI